MIYIVGIFIASLLIGRHLLSPDFLITHDSHLGLIKLVCMKKSWLEGQIFPRWSDDMLFGYGYPVFNFYQPFFTQLAVAISFILKNPVLSLNCASFLVYFASGLTMFLFVSSLWGRPAGFLAAIAYLFFPYHIVDVYIRGAYSELATFAILPFLLWAFRQLALYGRRRHMAALTLGIALLSITHNITNMLFTPWVILFGCILIFQAGFNKRRFIIQAGLSYGLGIGLTAFFWLPAIIEKKYVKIEKLYTGIYDFHLHFIQLKQLFNFVWNYSGPGPAVMDPVMTYDIGFVHVILVIAALILAFTRRARKNRAVLVFFILLTAISIFMTNQASVWVWEKISLLKFVQFPWRFLVFTALAISVLIGFLAKNMEGRWQGLFVLLAAGILAGANIIYANPSAKEKVKIPDDPAFVRGLSVLDAGEFLPRNVKQVLLPPPDVPVEIPVGEGVVTAYERKSSIRHQFTVLAKTRVLISFNSLYFPGWKVQENGKDIYIDQENPNGLIIFLLPKGEHKIDVFFASTPVRDLGKALSLLSLFVLILVVFYKRSWIFPKKQS